MIILSILSKITYCIVKQIALQTQLIKDIHLWKENQLSAFLKSGGCITELLSP